MSWNYHRESGIRSAGFLQVYICSFKKIIDKLAQQKFDWLILMACQPVLDYFMSKGLRNDIVCPYLHFLCSCFLWIFFCFFAHGLIKYEWFLDRSIWPIGGALTCTITPGQNGSVSNRNEGVLPRSPELEPHYLMQFRVISRVLFGGRYSQHVWSHTSRTVI